MIGNSASACLNLGGVPEIRDIGLGAILGEGKGLGIPTSTTWVLRFVQDDRAICVTNLRDTILEAKGRKLV